MNFSSVWSLVVATSSVQVPLFQSYYKEKDLKATLQELELDFGLPRINVHDYIVVGGGAAGCLIAGRLAEAGYQVLLLEKGGEPVPTIMNSLLKGAPYHPVLNDIYWTLPQRRSSLASGGIQSISAGIMLGGSGGHNALVYNRGSPEYYDEWARFVNDPSFSYESILSLFKKNEKMTGFLFSEPEREGYYGTHGPFHVETDLPLDFGDWFEVGRALGFSQADPNAHLSPSFTTVQTGTRDGLRETSYTAFILRRPNPNLTIFRFSNAQKVLIENRAAYGVVYLRHGITQIALAKLEVIVSAGTIASPLILLRSGVGPAAVMEQAGIPRIVDLPGVGSNFVDQPVLHLMFNIKSPEAAPRNDSQFLAFLSQHPGGRGATGSVGVQAFIRTSISPETGPWPDFHVHYSPDIITLSDAHFRLVMVRPESKGSLWFNTSALRNGETESTKIVLLDPSLFSNDRDMDSMIEGLSFTLNRILTAPQFKNREFSFVGNMMEGCETHAPNSKDFWICFVEQRAGMELHIIGSCRMGRDGDPLRVVDSNFRVIGVYNLRVADASVIPDVPNANTHAPVLAMAAKAVQALVQ